MHVKYTIGTEQNVTL